MRCRCADTQMCVEPSHRAGGGFPVSEWDLSMLRRGFERNGFPRFFRLLGDGRCWCVDVMPVRRASEQLPWILIPLIRRDRERERERCGRDLVSEPCRWTYRENAFLRLTDCPDVAVRVSRVSEVGFFFPARSLGASSSSRIPYHGWYPHLFFFCLFFNHAPMSTISGEE